MEVFQMAYVSSLVTNVFDNFNVQCYPGEDDLAVARAVLMYVFWNETKVELNSF